MNTRLIALVFALFLSFNAVAEANLDNFATNGRLTRNDIVRFLIQRKYPDLDAVKMSNQQLNSPVFEKIVLGAMTEYAGYRFPRDRQVFSLDEAKKQMNLPALPAANAPGFPKFGELNLREKWQDLKDADVGNAGKEIEPPSKAKPATFSITRNFLSNKTDWNVHAALFAPILLSSNVTFLPSASLNKISSADTNKQVDSFVFRAAFQYEINEYSTLRGGPLYATDLNFRSAQAGGELEWEPEVIKYGLGAFTGIPVFDKRIAYRFRFFLHVEGGDVIDRGDNRNLVEGTGFLRAGPFLQIELKPAFDPLSVSGRALNDLLFTTSFQDYEAMTDQTKSARLFLASVAYLFGEDKNFSVGLTYRQGRQALSAQQQKSLELSLGVMF